MGKVRFVLNAVLCFFFVLFGLGWVCGGVGKRLVFEFVPIWLSISYAESREKEEHFIELPPEICQLKIIGFSKDIGSSLSLLPSFMHRLESLLVAIELKDRLCSSFPEGNDVSASRVSIYSCFISLNDYLLGHMPSTVSSSARDSLICFNITSLWESHY